MLHDLHESREYGKIAQLITEEHRALTLKLLIALDDAVAANANLRRTAETAYYGPQSEYWDLASMENNLGVFSRKIALISVAYRGDEAVVSLQQGDCVPVVHVTFVLRNGKWLLLPDPAPEQLPTELNELARLIREVESEVARGASLNAYADAFFYRVIPQMRRIALAGSENQPVITAWTPNAD